MVIKSYPGKLLKITNKGTNVKYVQECLNYLGYNCGTADGIFGSKTKSQIEKFQVDNNLSADGIVGALTWTSLVAEVKKKQTPPAKVVATSNLKLGSKGTEVKSLQNKLNSLGYNCGNADGVFGSKTKRAVIKFQSDNKLTADGIVGALTWTKLDSAKKVVTEATIAPRVPITKSEFNNLSDITINKLNSAWVNSSDKVINFMKLCIAHAVDTVNGTYASGSHLNGLYVIGSNLYNKYGKIDNPTESYLRSRAKIYPSYFSNGRLEFMIKEIKANPNIKDSDCSGMIIGAGWKSGVYSGGDTTADNLSSKSVYSTNIIKSQLIPGDWVAKSGHIGVYLGGGLVVEFAGGAYGCQITDLNNRKCRNYMTGSLEAMASWTRFRRPRWY